MTDPARPTCNFDDFRIEEFRIEDFRPADAADTSRSAQPLPTRGLDWQAAVLLDAIGPRLPLTTLRTTFPHVLNRLVAVWSNPKLFTKAIDDLMVDDRGGRRGFPFATLNELTDLRVYYFSHVHPQATRPDPAHGRGWR